MTDMTDMTNEAEKKEWELFEKRYEKYNKMRAEDKERILTQDEINKCREVWKQEFTSFRGRYRKEHFDRKKENDYKDCLFTINKYHWDDDDGFQINMKQVGILVGKSAQTVDRIILFLIRCGLLVRCHNYMAGKHTYFYHKNAELFNHLFRGETDDYMVWINSDKSGAGAKKIVDNNIYKQSNNVDHQSILIEQQQEYDDTDDETDDNIKANVIKNKRGRKRITYEPDTELYKKIVDGYLSKYEKLNKGKHEDLKIDFGLHFNERGNYSGRSKSYFCLTLNEKKEHKSDNTMEKRSDFLKRVGLADYKEIYDIKSEVPRTTILANTGVWKPDSYDAYEEARKLSVIEIINRELVKKLYMRFNFGTGTLKQRFNYYRNSRIEELKKEHGLESYIDAEKLYYFRLQDIFGKYPVTPLMQCGTLMEYTFEEWVELGEAIEKIQGKSWGSLIFWWTSLIQVQTLYTVLEEKKIRVYNVYDSFYGPDGITKEYIKEVIERSALFVYENYIKEVAEKRAKNNAVHNGGGSNSDSDSAIKG